VVAVIGFLLTFVVIKLKKAVEVAFAPQ